MRYAIGRGIHRRKSHNHRPNAEDESARRAFWCAVSLIDKMIMFVTICFRCLFCLDRIISSFTGRPCVIHSEECVHTKYHSSTIANSCILSDSMWNIPSSVMTSTGKPRTLIRTSNSLPGNLAQSQLSKLLSSCVRSSNLHCVHCIPPRNPKYLLGIPAMNGKVASSRSSTRHLMPGRMSFPIFVCRAICFFFMSNLTCSMKTVRWDPGTPSSDFFHQSVVLYTTYYYTQMQVHRPFLTKKSPLSFRSLAICTNAARTCTQVLEAGSTRGLHDFPNLIVE